MAEMTVNLMAVEMAYMKEFEMVAATVDSTDLS